MSLEIENKKQNRTSFLDVHIICEDKKLITSFDLKPTFSEVFLTFL